MTDSHTLLIGALIVVVAVGVLYLVDPTLGGVLPSLKRMVGLEGFEGSGVGDGSLPAMNPTNGQASMGTGAELAAAVKKAASALGGNSTTTNPSGLPSTDGAMLPGSNQATSVTGPANGVPSGGSASPSSMSVTENFMNLSPSPMPFPGGSPPGNCYPTNALKPQDLLPRDDNSKWAAVNPMGAGDIAGKNFLSAGAMIGVNTVGQSLRNANHDLRSDPPCPQVVVSPWLNTNISPDLLRKPLE